MRVQTTRLQEIPPAEVVWHSIVTTVRSGITRKAGGQLVVHVVPEPGHAGIQGRMAGNARRIGQPFLAPN